MNKFKIKFDDLRNGMIIETKSLFYVVVKTYNNIILVDTNHKDEIIVLNCETFDIVIDTLEIKALLKTDLSINDILYKGMSHTLLHSDYYIKYLTNKDIENLTNSFTRNNLESGMLVIFEDGDKGIVINDYIAARKQYLPLSRLNRDLTCSHAENCNINKVFCPTRYLSLLSLSEFDLGNYTLVFDRKEITLENLASTLNTEKVVIID